MDLSKTTRYALRLMSYMASSEETSISTLELHKQLGIPKQYLRRLMTRLSRKELLVSDKGRSGGFTLARPKSDIFLSEIISATDDTPLLQACILGFDTCRLVKKCPLHDKWSDARQNMIETFRSVSLADMEIEFIR
jgi:Rrf2 family transcriptional regulator, iron-sulfur cluster assembly transcription factor